MRRLQVISIMACFLLSAFSIIGCGGKAANIRLIYNPIRNEVSDAALDADATNIASRLKLAGITCDVGTEIDSKSIIVDLGNKNDSDRAKEIIGKTGQLQFRIVIDSIAVDDAKYEPNWKMTEGEQNLQPDKEIILPYMEAMYTEAKTKMLLKLGPTLMTGDALLKAQVTSDMSGEPGISFTLAGDGKKKFADITSANVNKQLAIVLDYVVESAPKIEAAITDGRGEIAGGFTKEEATDLAVVLTTGTLKVPLELVKEQLVRSEHTPESATSPEPPSIDNSSHLQYVPPGFHQLSGDRVP